MQRLGGIALAPKRQAEPVAELRRLILLQHHATGADDRSVAQRDQEHRLAAGLVGAGNETLGIRHFVRMRNARRVFGDAAVVGERRYRFSVLEARRAQGKPLGIEDGDTTLVEGLSRYSLQQCHGTGSIVSTQRLKYEEGEPASRLPLSCLLYTSP